MSSSNNPFLNIKPNVVSKDLESHAYFIAGLPKTGKTTLGSMFPRSVVFCLERGGDCIPNLMGIEINNWDDLESKIEYLNSPETRERFSMVVIDTVDRMLEFAYDKIVSKYNSILQNESNGKSVERLEDMVDVGLKAKTNGNHWNKAYDLVRKALIKIFKVYRYGLMVIGHTKEKTITQRSGKTDKEYTVQSYVINDSCLRMINEIVDVSCFVRNEIIHNDKTDTDIFFPVCYFRSSGNFSAGNRFKYLNGKIPFTYENFTNAIKTAIQKEEEEVGKKYFKEEKDTGTYTELGLDSFEGCKNFISQQLSILQRNFANSTERNFTSFWMVKINEIISNKTNGRKLSDLQKDETDLLIEIRESIQSLINQYA